MVLESTTYPGTTDELLRPILEESGLHVADGDFFLGYSPERIDPGNTEWTFVNTAKVVSGLDAASLSVVEAFYGALVDKIVPVASTGEAELVKLLENTFRHVNIALVNELAMFARSLGVDIWSAIDAAATKPYGFMRFTPGPGVGGHCLPVDPAYLAWRVERQIGQRFRFVELANEVNRGMPDYVVGARRVDAERRAAIGERRADPAARARVQGGHAATGASAPSMMIAERLLELGADVRAHDPLVPDDAPLGPPIAARRLHGRGARSGRSRGAVRRPRRAARTTTSSTTRGSCSTPAAGCAASASAASRSSVDSVAELGPPAAIASARRRAAFAARRERDDAREHREHDEVDDAVDRGDHEADRGGEADDRGEHGRDRLAGAEPGREEADRRRAHRGDHERGRLRVRHVEAQRGGDEEQAQRLHEHERALDREELDRAREAVARVDDPRRASPIATASRHDADRERGERERRGATNSSRDAAERARGADPREPDDRGEVQAAP